MPDHRTPLDGRSRLVAAGSATSDAVAPYARSGEALVFLP